MTSQKIMNSMSLYYIIYIYIYQSMSQLSAKFLSLLLSSRCIEFKLDTCCHGYTNVWKISRLIASSVNLELVLVQLKRKKLVMPS